MKENYKWKVNSWARAKSIVSSGTMQAHDGPSDHASPKCSTQRLNRATTDGNKREAGRTMAYSAVIANAAGSKVNMSDVKSRIYLLTSYQRWYMTLLDGLLYPGIPLG